MFSKLLLCCLCAYVAAQVAVEDNPPQPYSFGYDNTDEFGTRLTRQETGDEFNGKVGSYSYTDAAGVHRTVNYIADAAGFRATVDTNEPGTKTSEPADAATVSAAVEGPHPDVVKAPPQPYSFGFDNVDEFGTRMTRQETGDECNNKVGSYSYVDAFGVSRVVKYVADATGFHPIVETKEPGSKTSVPADAPFFSTAVEGPHPVVVKAALVAVKSLQPELSR
ncbi:putative cuticular protein [Ixodes scapularis]